jgi:putative phosphoribosyl transferase
MRFLDREEAGRRLGERLAHHRGQDVLVLAIPRGGVPVGAMVAEATGGELDVSVARKLGAPWQPELALGAISAGATVINEDVVSALGVPESVIEAVIAREKEEVERRNARFRAGRPAPRIRGRVVIVVDDGIATGATVKATLQSVRLEGPRWLVLAVPVAPPRTIDALRRLCDECVCLHAPPDFVAVGQFYSRFQQTDDAEVVAILDRARRGRAPD